MSPIDIAVIAVIVGLVALAMRAALKKGGCSCGSGGCTGDCASCHGACSKKPRKLK